MWVYYPHTKVGRQHRYGRYRYGTDLMKLAPLVSVVRRRTTSAGARIPFSMTTMSPTLRAELATLTSPRSVSLLYLSTRQHQE